MKQRIKNIIKSTLQKLDIGIIRCSNLDKLFTAEKLYHINSAASQDIEILLQLPIETASQRVKFLRNSKSQLRQDLFALSCLSFRTNGFFVEFGAANGIDRSNTYLMEKEFGWSGILAEPAKCWHEDLRKNRSCSISTDCVWKSSHSILTFNEVDWAELSTIHSYSDKDFHKRDRERGKTYDVMTISLNDLLEKYNAPTEIDYLSIDTEGSEFEILSHFDFKKYTIQVITCEHNYTPIREKIFNLLAKYGYIRVFQDLSKADDWYIKSTPPQL